MASNADTGSAPTAPARGTRGLVLPVFLPALLIVAAALAAATWYGAAYGEEASEAFTSLRDAVGEGVGWWYALVVAGFLAFSAWAVFSKAGAIRLGRDDEGPEFSRFSWFAMLFSAGMGIGLVFWGVAEPLTHLVEPPAVAGNEPGTRAAGGAAIGQALFHWGLHAWGIYAVVGLGLAYMSFRRGRPLSVRWLLEPVLGRRLIESWAGHAIDVFAIVGTIFGVATSLGQGALQIQAGLAHIGWFEPSPVLLSVLVAVFVACATLSVVSGLNRGLRWLSNANMALAAVLALCVLVLGPTVFLFRSLVQNTGEYMQALPQFMFVTGAGAADTWTLNWTLFNQAWFLSWAPFVGMFIARISRGRTIREFMLGVVLAPTAIAAVWFTVFGSTGVLYQLRDGSMTGGDGAVDTNTTLFLLFENLPGGAAAATVLSVLALAVIVLFFVTSADSCALVVDVLAHGGRSETPRSTRMFWSVLLGVAGIVLLTAGGEAALTVLQVSSILGAAPLSVIYALAVLALVRMLRYEASAMPRYVRIRPQATPSALVAAARAESDGEVQVQDNLRALLKARSRAAAGRRTGASAALGGLAPGTGAAQAGSGPVAAEAEVLAVHDVPPEAVAVDTSTGLICLKDGSQAPDPAGAEVFDTPEFADSAAGAERETEELLRRSSSA
ncbi:BCCT family transporter [Nocardiopsis coralliicola]